MDAYVSGQCYAIIPLCCISIFFFRTRRLHIGLDVFFGNRVHIQSRVQSWTSKRDVPNQNILFRSKQTSRVFSIQKRTRLQSGGPVRYWFTRGLECVLRLQRFHMTHHTGLIRKGTSRAQVIHYYYRPIDLPERMNIHPHTHHMAEDHKQVKTLQRCQIFFSFLNESALVKDLWS